jgi:hypothetical protein
MSVNNTVKALPKKRRNQVARNLSSNISKACMLKYQALWYATSIIAYVWFMYWLACDFFIWHKPIAEINPVNYIGSIASLAFIWAGTKVWKPNRVKVQSQQQTLISQKLPEQKPPQTKPQQNAPANSKCSHYFGYLHERQASQEIPAECLTCEQVLQCFSSTK